MKQAYLDNSATTAVCRQAADKAYEMMTVCYGNPSSLHTVGFAAEQELTAARRAVAKLLGCPPDTLTFTSGGTEANNLAILGGWAARKRRGSHAVTTAVEHPSVAAAFDALEKEGVQVERLVPDERGRLTAEQIAAACREDTILVSVMLVNNETGARFPHRGGSAAYPTPRPPSIHPLRRGAGRRENPGVPRKDGGGRPIGQRA